MSKINWIHITYRFDEIFYKSFLCYNQELSTETINRKPIKEPRHLRVPGSKIRVNFNNKKTHFYRSGSLNKEMLASTERTE